MDLSILIGFIACCIIYKIGAYASARELEIERWGLNGKGADKAYIIATLEHMTENDFDRELFTLDCAKSRLYRIKTDLIELTKNAKGELYGD